MRRHTAVCDKWFRVS